MALILTGASGSTTLDSSAGLTFSDSSNQAAAASPNVLKNRIINGAMMIDQRYAGAATANTIDGYTLDRWQVECNGVTGKLIAQQNAGSVTPPTGFKNYLGVTSQSAYTVGTSDRFVVDQFIEGLNVYDLGWGTANAQTVTLSFWVRSSLTGTFGGSLSNSAVNRSYPFSYTISSANTWEQKTIIVAGDTSGTWLTTNGIGIRLYFGLGVGSTYSGTAGSWSGSFYQSATGSTSVVGTNGATFYITGVQLEQSSTATPFERRLYNQELANCQRYYIQYIPATIYPGFQDGTTAVTASIITPVSLRSTPTMTLGAGTTYCLRETTNAQSTSTTLSNINLFGVNQLQFKLGGFTGLSDLRVCSLYPSGTVTISAEL